jgi:hypothetical protein
MGRRLVFVATLLVALFGAPRPSDAGLLEIIWEMSGPRMFGVGYSCLYSLDSKLNLLECRIGSGFAAMKDRRPYRPFLVVGGSGFFSVPYKQDTPTPYDWFDANMLAFEPGVAVLSKLEPAEDGLRIGHGVGISYDFLFGNHFEGFDKLGFTFTPVEVSYRRFAIAAKIRAYPNGFTPDEFGFGPRVTGNRKSEVVYGLNVSYIIRP